MQDEKPPRNSLVDAVAEPRRARSYRADGRRRFVLPLLARLAHDRHMECEEPQPTPSTRPRPWLN